MKIKEPGFGEHIFRIIYPIWTRYTIFVAKPFDRSSTKYSPLMLIEDGGKLENIIELEGHPVKALRYWIDL
jgi:hypothetical protein